MTSAETIAALEVPITFHRAGVDIHISTLQAQGNTLFVIASARKEGVALIGTEENPLIYVNPPVQVPDSTKRRERVKGIEIERDNFRIDPLEALKEIVLDTARFYGNANRLS